jgi:hypothetical protein
MVRVQERPVLVLLAIALNLSPYGIYISGVLAYDAC